MAHVHAVDRTGGMGGNLRGQRSAHVLRPTGMRILHGVPALMLSCTLLGQVLVQVPPERYGVDPALGMMVVAMSGEEVAAEWAGLKIGVSADVSYTFMVPVEDVLTGVPYDAVGPEGEEVAIFFTDLPLVKVHTEHEIPDEPRVPAFFTMWAPEQVLVHHPIGIEIRGGSSQDHPKKSYRLEFLLHPDHLDPVDVALLGMRSDDDWNLEAMAIEPLRLRSVVGQELWMDIHQPYYGQLAPEARSGVRHAYVELFINDAYKGLYALGERVDRKQLQVMPYAWGVQGEIYKGVGWGGSTFTAIPPPFAPGDTHWGGFEHIYPRGHPQWEELADFVHLVVEGTAPDLYHQLDQRFHRGNAIDYYIFLNVLKAVDNTGKNIFLARFNTGDPYFYVPWDLDGTFGWSWDGTPDPGILWSLSNGLFDRWLQDQSVGGFRDDLCRRWDELRAGPLALDAIMDRFHTHHARLAASGVYHREERAWEGYLHQPGHLGYIENWLAERLGHLDDGMEAMCVTVGVHEHRNAWDVQVFPNPATDHVTVQLPEGRVGIPVQLMDATGRIVAQERMLRSRVEIPLRGLAAGLYHVVISPPGQAPVHRALLVH